LNRQPFDAPFYKPEGLTQGPEQAKRVEGGRQGNQLIIKIKPNNTDPRMKTNLLFRLNKIKSFNAKPQRSQRKATFCSSQIKSEALTQSRKAAKKGNLLFKSNKIRSFNAKPQRSKRKPTFY